MGINLLAGRDTKAVPLESCYSLAGTFVHEFEAAFGSTNCSQLTGCDLGSPEGVKFFRDNNLIKKCRGYTVEATRMTLGILQRLRDKERQS